MISGEEDVDDDDDRQHQDDHQKQVRGIKEGAPFHAFLELAEVEDQVDNEGGQPEDGQNDGKQLDRRPDAGDKERGEEKAQTDGVEVFF